MFFLPCHSIIFLPFPSPTSNFPYVSFFPLSIPPPISFLLPSPSFPPYIIFSPPFLPISFLFSPFFSFLSFLFFSLFCLLFLCSSSHFVHIHSILFPCLALSCLLSIFFPSVSVLSWNRSSFCRLNYH